MPYEVEMGFMISVDGGRAPQFVHESAEQAMTEAVRLQNTDGGRGRRVRILSEVFIIEPNDPIPSPLKPTVDKVTIKDPSIKFSLAFIANLFRFSVSS